MQLERTQADSTARPLLDIQQARTQAKELEGRARKCYAECIGQTKDEFVEMMLLDGCFIIELFRKCKGLSPRDDHDPIFQIDWMLNAVEVDLLLFENQLPYFVLDKLFEIRHSGEQIGDIEQKYEISRYKSSTSTDQVIRLHDIAIHVFPDNIRLSELNVGHSSHRLTEKSKIPLLDTFINVPLDEHGKVLHVENEKVLHDEYERVRSKLSNADFKHLLDYMMHTIIKFLALDTELNHVKESQEVGVKFKKGVIFKHLFGLMRSFVSPSVAEMEKKGVIFKHLSGLMRSFVSPSVAEMEKIKKGVNKKSTSDTKKQHEYGYGFNKFTNGVLEIPYWRIADSTETFLRNLLAYEQYSLNEISNYVTDYVIFMDDLIDSPKDVELLRREGIIDNWLGDDEVVSTMINKLGDNIITPDPHHTYAQTRIAINKHCRIRRNQWMAKLWLEYFNSPWSLLSFLAAVVLLGVSITQTIFAILSYK
ncbi:hypothetical protein I3842_01G124200 [Carya illinoinensis]|uniref:Uncharacterized protein n=1 Tax=Carya illinoinensis TaxID=32201 RepID=A0A922G2S7_CARIL|nr:hypothetical protein I3842_01G124200 [Carya illinoinensis]